MSQSSASITVLAHPRRGNGQLYQVAAMHARGGLASVAPG